MAKPVCAVSLMGTMGAEASRCVKKKLVASVERYCAPIVTSCELIS
jgi:hypothetical protein